MSKKRVVITGMSIASCLGCDYKKFYEALLDKKCGIRDISEFFNTEGLTTTIGAPVEGFSTEGYIDKKNARRIDRCIAYGIVCGLRAVEDAKLTIDEKMQPRVGTLVGTGMGGMQVYTDNLRAMILKGHSRVSPFFVPYIIPNMTSALLAIELKAKGPNYSVNTACATSNYAVTLAAEHIMRGDADVMITGGIEAPINEMCYSGFCALKALSRDNENPKGSVRPWDKNRSGFTMGDGGAVFVLESLEHALARGAPILAEYKGGAFTCDAHHMTEPHPEGIGVAECLTLAMEDAGVQRCEIDYINCHATSTPVGDLCEIRALKKAFGEHIYDTTINATKPNVGHALGGAGAIELVATIMALQTGKIHPTLNVTDPEEEIEGIDFANNAIREKDIKLAVSNSFGFGGHNSAIVVGKYDG